MDMPATELGQQTHEGEIVDVLAERTCRICSIDRKPLTDARTMKMTTTGKLPLFQAIFIRSKTDATLASSRERTCSMVHIRSSLLHKVRASQASFSFLPLC